MVKSLYVANRFPKMTTERSHEQKDFERAFRARHGIKDSAYVDDLWEEFGADYDNNRKDKDRLEEVWGVIGREVRSYKIGRARGRTERERDRTTRNERFDEEHVTIRPPGGAYEVARAKAVSEYVAKVASTDTVTIRYRERVLGRTLAAHKAERFLFSPVAASVRASIGPRVKPRRVSFLDYEIGEQAEDDSGHYRVLRYNHAGRDLETRLRPVLQVPGRGGSFMVYPGDTVSPDEWWQNIPDQNADVLLPIRSGDSVVAKSNSALDLLMKQADKLFHRYLLEPAEAAWLILTGEPPKPKYMSASLTSLSTDDLSRAALTLTLEPWVSPDKVTSYIRDIRQSILHGAGSKARTVEVFRFVVAHTEVEETTLEKIPRWRHLCELWNEEYPEDHRWHFADYRDFRTAYIRGRDAIALPISE
jgi:hypothetical protein